MGLQVRRTKPKTFSSTSFKGYVSLVSAHTQNQMDKELHHTRGALHMEAFTDVQMWEFSERWGERQGETQSKRKSIFMGFILGGGLE